MADETQVDTAPIGRISWQDAMPGMNDTSAPEEAKPLPTLNPSNSPYTPLELPQVQPRPFDNSGPQVPQNLGNVTHGGAVAYMVDSILKGAARGVGQAQAYQADQYNRKLAAQQSIYNDQAKQLYDMTVAGIDPNSQEFRAARGRVLASWQAVMQTMGERIPQPKKSKKSQQGQATGTDQTTLLQTAMDKSKPQDAIQATYQIASKMGPPVFHQIAPYLTPQYQQQQRQKAQIAASEQTGQLATTEAATAKAQNEARLQQLLAQAPPTDPTAAKAREDEISRLQEALAPPQRTFKASETTRYRTDPQGNEIQYQIDPYSGEEVQGTEKIVKTAASVAPKGWKVAGQIATNADTGQQFALNDPNAPGFVKSVKAAIDASKDVTTVGTHTVMVWNGTTEVPVQVETTSTKSVGGTAHPSGGTARTSSSGAPNAGVVSTGSPVGYKLSPETTTLLKNTGAANTAYQAAVSTYNDAKRDAVVAKTPQGGVARMNLLADFLKSLGAHTAGVSGSQVRLTNVEWQYAVQSAPILQRIAAKFGVNSSGGVTYLSGITLSPEQIDSLVAEMGRKALTAGDTLQSLRKQAQASQQRDAGVIRSTPNQSPASSGFDFNAYPAAQ